MNIHQFSYIYHPQFTSNHVEAWTHHLKYLSKICLGLAKFKNKRMNRFSPFMASELGVLPFMKLNISYMYLMLCWLI